MPDDVEPRRPAADKGTGLGASTNALTRMFAVLLWPIAAIPRAGHALGRVVGRVVRRVFGGEHRLLRRLALLVGACAALIGRACHAVVHALGRVLAPIGVLFRIMGTAIARVADHHRDRQFATRRHHHRPRHRTRRHHDLDGVRSCARRSRPTCGPRDRDHLERMYACDRPRRTSVLPGCSLRSPPRSGRRFAVWPR